MHVNKNRGKVVGRTNDSLQNGFVPAYLASRVEEDAQICLWEKRANITEIQYSTSIINTFISSSATIVV